MATYSAAVEQWRPLAEKHFPPELVDKVLYLINGESGGDPGAVGDGGAANGLFQSHYIGKGTTPDQQFADALRLYTADKANGGTGFGDWGEGRLYQGKPFGALGNHPYGGGGTTMGTNSTSAGSGFDFASTLAQFPPPNPQEYQDPLEYQAAVAQWAQTISSLASASRSLNPDAKDPAQQKFENDSTTFANQIRKGELDLETAGKRVDRMLNGMAESRNRADTIARGQEQIGKYGTTPGKTSFSGRDLGAAFDGVVGAMGLKPTDSLINYSGTQRIDPAADMLAGDRALGVGGSLPEIGRPAVLDLGVPTWATEQLGEAAKGTQQMPPNNGVFQGGTPPPLNRDSSEPRNGMTLPPLNADSSEPRSGAVTRVATPVGAATTTAPTTAAPALAGWTIDPKTGQLRPPALPSSFFCGTGF